MGTTVLLLFIMLVAAANLCAGFAAAVYLGHGPQRKGGAAEEHAPAEQKTADAHDH